jgi:hypothetical protein
VTEILADVYEVLEHLAANHIFRDEGTASRVRELLAGIGERVRAAVDGSTTVPEPPQAPEAPQVPAAPEVPFQ